MYISPNLFPPFLGVAYDTYMYIFSPTCYLYIYTLHVHNESCTKLYHRDLVPINP